MVEYLPVGSQEAPQTIFGKKNFQPSVQCNDVLNARYLKMSLFVPVVKGMAIEKWVNVTSGDRDALKVALAKHGPISVGIDAAHKSLSFYSNGVYYEPKCGNTTDALVRYTYPKV